MGNGIVEPGTIAEVADSVTNHRVGCPVGDVAGGYFQSIEIDDANELAIGSRTDNAGAVHVVDALGVYVAGTYYVRLGFLSKGGCRLVADVREEDYVVAIPSEAVGRLSCRVHGIGGPNAVQPVTDGIRCGNASDADTPVVAFDGD